MSLIASSCLISPSLFPVSSMCRWWAIYDSCSKKYATYCHSPYWCTCLFLCSGWYVGQTRVPDMGAGVLWEGPAWWRWASQTPPTAFTAGIHLSISSSVSYHHQCSDGLHLGNMLNIHTAINSDTHTHILELLAVVTGFDSCQQFVIVHSPLSVLTFAESGQRGPQPF